MIKKAREIKLPPTLGFVQVWLDKQTISQLQIQAVVRAGQATFNFSSYFQLYIFNQQRLWADGILMPHLHKVLLVGGHCKLQLVQNENFTLT